MQGGRWGGRTLFQMLSKTSTPSWTFLRTRSISPCSFRLAPMAATGLASRSGAARVYDLVGQAKGEEWWRLGRGRRRRFGTGFGFPRSCLRRVMLARRNVDWTGVFFFFEWTGLTCFRFERSGLCPWADDIFMSCSSKNFSKFSITTNLTAYAWNIKYRRK